MNPHEEGRSFPEWLQREPDEYWDRRRARARSRLWLLAGLVVSLIAVAVVLLVAPPVLP